VLEQRYARVLASAPAPAVDREALGRPLLTSCSGPVPGKVPD
jgi:hypothetical protein